MALCNVSYPELIWVGAGLMIVVLVVAKMLSKIKSMPGLESWINVEKGEFINNLIILISFVAFYNISSAIAMEWLNSTGYYSFTPTAGCTYDMLKQASSLMYTIINSKMVPALVAILHQIHSFEIFSGYSAKITSLEGLDITQKITQGYDVILAPLNTVRLAAVMFIAGAGFQLMFLEGLRAIAYDFLLPLAIVMRFLPPTRNAANEILGVIFAFVIMFPFLYLLLLPALDEIFLFYGMESLYSVKGFSSGSVISSLLMLSITYLTIANLFFNAFISAVDKLAYMAIVGAMLPSFILTTSITFVKSFKEVLSLK